MSKQTGREKRKQQKDDFCGFPKKLGSFFWIVSKVHFFPETKDEKSVSTRRFWIHTCCSNGPVGISHLSEGFSLIVIATSSPDLVHVLPVLWVIDEDLIEAKHGHREIVHYSHNKFLNIFLPRSSQRLDSKRIFFDDFGARSKLGNGQ